jgi:signal transduction histidine kinase
MSEEMESLIFAEFSQADDSTTRTYGGAGLGLALCKRFVDLLDGSIELTSEVDVGTTVEVLLPERLPGHREAGEDQRSAHAA